MITGANNIGGRLSAQGLKLFKTFNSTSNTENPWDFVECSIQELEEAVSLAQKAFPIYKATSPSIRAAFLRKIASNIVELGDHLLNVYQMESSLTEFRARAERERTVNQLLAFADLLEQGKHLEIIFHNGKNDLRKTQVPVGPVVVFGSSNFPLAYSTIGGDSASALAAGCPVIVKSHPMHAGTGELVSFAVTKALSELGLPAGVFSNLNAVSHEIGAQLVQHASVKAVGFTGSLKGGKALFDLCRTREEPIPFFAEMGSLNPVCIHHSAIKDHIAISNWAVAYCNSISESSGQFCTKPGLIIAVDSPSFRAFVEELGALLNEREAGAMLHPDLYSNFIQSILPLLSIEANQKVGSTEYAGMVQNRLFSCKAKEFIEDQSFRNELFGPAALVVFCDSHSEMLNVLHKLEGQLTATLLMDTQDHIEAKELIEVLIEKAGRIICNGVPTGVEVCEAMHHGGPYPATTDSRFTAVGVHSIRRWLRPVVFQNVPASLLPVELRNS